MKEFEAAYPDEEACWNALVRARWPQGYRCPRCSGPEATLLRKRRLFQCRACRYQGSVAAGTILQDTKLPLRTWFWALFFYATTKKSVSACELQRKLGLGTYRAAWLLHAKLQRVLGTSPSMLRGLVEVDEAFIGQVTHGASGRGTGKAVVGLAAEERGEHAGKMAAWHVQDAGAARLGVFVEANVVQGSIVKTDGFRGYDGLEERGFQHAPEPQRDPTRAPEVLPRVHVISGNLKRVLNGTHSGRVSRRHLHAYLDEFTFRYNHRGFLHKALGIALDRMVRRPPLTYRMVVC